MVRPLLFIGAGGAGGKTLRAIISELELILESSGYVGGIPEGWQFINFDTTYDGVSFPFPMLSRERHYQVVRNGVLFRDIKQEYEKGKTEKGLQDILTGWGATVPAVHINTSPSTQRAVGRHAAIPDANGMLKSLQHSIAKMKSPVVTGQLAEIAEHLGFHSVDPTPQAFLISSLGGTTGSGIFLDIAEILKSASSELWVNNLTSFLYTPEVFNSIGHMKQDFTKNALGAIAEMSAGRFNGLSERSHFLYKERGINSLNSASASNFGCRTNFLIGSKNSKGVNIEQGPHFAGMDEVIREIGQSLANVISDPICSEYLYNQLYYLAGSQSSMVDISGLSPARSQGMVNSSFASGIGFAKLSLGSDLMIDYVADALTRKQVERLLWPEVSVEMLESDIPVSQKIDEAVEIMWPDFLNKSGLNERGSSTQISDKLIPKNWIEDAREIINLVVVGNVSKDTIALADFVKTAWRDWETESTNLLRQVESKIQENVANWSSDRRISIPKLVADYLISAGFGVIRELTIQLESELSNYSKIELAEESKQHLAAAQGFDFVSFQRRIAEIAGDQTGISLKEEEILDELKRTLEKVISLRILGAAKSFAALAIEEMCESLIKSLITSLGHAHYSLSRNLKVFTQSDGRMNPFPKFPVWGSGQIPKQYEARSTEVTMIMPSEYEEVFNSYVMRGGKESSSFESLITQAALWESPSIEIGGSVPQPLVAFESQNEPTVVHTQSRANANAPSFEWSFHVGIEDLRMRNKHYLRNTPNPILQLSTMSIKDYVNDPDIPGEGRQEREKRFVTQFEAFLKISDPLISLNEGAISKYLSHPRGKVISPLPLLKIGRIPFSQESEIGKLCASILEKNGHDVSAPGFEKEFFDSSSTKKSISAISTTQGDLPVWAFASLSEPILEEVSRSLGVYPTWEYFSEGRRARPLLEAIPLEAEIRRSIITGWFVARLLGMREIQNSDRGTSVRVWNRTLISPDWSQFPNPLLAPSRGDAPRGNSILPSLLKSAGLALLQFGKSADQSAIEGYLYLKYLGREVTCSIPNRDMWDNNGIGDQLPNGEMQQSTLIRDWVNDALNPSKDGSVLPLLQKILDRGESREVALLEALENTRLRYQKTWKECETLPWYNLPETWELKEDIELALTDTIEYVKCLSIQV